MSIYDQEKCWVYWLYDESCADPQTDGYIGISKHLRHRFIDHKCNKRFPKNFRMMILYEGTREQCKDIEFGMRPRWRMGWNLACGGRAGGGPLSVEHRKNIGKGHLGKKRSKEQIQKMRDSFRTNRYDEWMEITKTKPIRAKLWTIEKDGIEFEVKNLKKYCRENGLNYGTIISRKYRTKKIRL